MTDPGKAFYNHSYAARGSQELSQECSITKSYGHHDDGPDVRADHLRLVREFVSNFDLRDARVLEIGAGTGGLQDIVPNYVACDLSATAARFFHKPFVVASATELPFAVSSFDAVWSFNVFEHVPDPESGFLEIRRVLRPGGLLFLYPAWYTRPWFAQGYEVRPYADFDLKGKLIKASIPLRDAFVYRAVRTVAARAARLAWHAIRRRPARLRYKKLAPNYSHYWVSDSDAACSLDPFEAILWFTSRGDMCLSHPTVLRQFLARFDPVVLRINKAS